MAAHAQSPVLETRPNPDESQAGTPGTDIVVTARKVTERLQDVPISISVFDAQQLQAQGTKDVKDLQTQTPNLYFQDDISDPSALFVTIRGQGQNDTLPTTDGSVGIYLDGVYIPRTIGLRSNLVDVARVEILRGPQGTLFGRNTTGGAVSLITQAPKQETGGYFRGRLQNYSGAEALGVLNIGLPSLNGGIRIVGQLGVRNGFGKDGFGRDLRSEDSRLLRGRAKFETGDLTIDIRGDISRSESGGAISRLAGLRAASGANPPGAPGILQIAAEQNITNAQASALWATYLYGAPGDNPYRTGSTPAQASASSRAGGAGLTLEWKAADAIQVRSITGYRELRYNSFNDYDGTPFHVIDVNLGSNGKYFSQELQLVGSAGSLDWILGGFYDREKGHYFAMSFALPAINTVTNPNRPLADARNTSVAGFAQATWHATDALSFTGGFRWTKETKRLVSFNSNKAGCSIPVTQRDIPGVCRGTFQNSFSDPSFLASADYKFSPDMMAYVSVSRGFRGGGQNLRGNANLGSFDPYKPEIATVYEVGMKSELFDRRLRFNWAGYYTDYKDIQRSVTVAGPSSTPTNITIVSIVSNAASAEIYGGEFEASLRVSDAFTLSATYGYTHGNYKSFVDFSGDRSREEFPFPEHTASLSGRYAIPTPYGSLALQADYRYQSKVNLYPALSAVLTSSQVTQKGYGLLNARLSLTGDDQRYDIALFGRNLTDKVYKSAAQGFETSLGFNTVYIGDPRVVGLEFTLKFGGER
jgi:iron complex outermembrane receptor protein